MKKIFKAVVAAVSLVACLGAFAFGGATKASADLYWTTMEKLEGRTPECALFLEEPKVKNMADYGYYNVDGQDVWYFYGDGRETANPEIRFVTEGTDTTKKINGAYTFAPMQVDSFSFDYRIENDTSKKHVADTDAKYIVQILASDSTYPIIIPDINEDGGWHTIYVDQWTPVSNAAGNTYKSIDHLFSGVIFKMAGLDGELMIANIQLKSNGADVPVLNPYDEPELPEDSDENELPMQPVDSVETPVESEEPETSNDIAWESDEPASDSLWMDDEEEEPTSEQPQTSEQPEESAEGGVIDKVIQTLGCASTIGGSSVLLTMVGAGIMMAIRKRKE
jgi:hypothetical protein